MPNVLRLHVGLCYGQSFRVGSRKARGFSGNRGGLALRLQFQRRFHELSDSRPEPCKIADIPSQQNFCSRLQSAVSNECVIGGRTDDSPRRSLLKSGNIFLLTERNQGEPFAYLLDDVYAFRPSDARPKRQASERSVDLAEGGSAQKSSFPASRNNFVQVACCGWSG